MCDKNLLGKYAVKCDYWHGLKLLKYVKYSLVCRVSHGNNLARLSSTSCETSAEEEVR